MTQEHCKQDATDTRQMSLFTADLFRNFAIGFALGGAIVGLQVGSANWDSIAPALAAIFPL